MAAQSSDRGITAEDVEHVAFSHFAFIDLVQVRAYTRLGSIASDLEVCMMYECFKRATLLTLTFAAGMWAADPVVGTWVMNAKKSVFQPGPAPRTQTRVYRESPDGITATVVTLSADGKSSTVEYPVNYDGQTHPVTGSTDIDAIKMVKITSYRSESTLMHAGRVIATTVPL